MHTQTQSGYAILARVYWIIVGPMVLFVTTGVIVSQRGGWATPADIVFLVALAAMVAAKWIEFQGGNAKMSNGELATRADVVRFSVTAIPVGLAIWAAANLFGQYGA